MSIKKISKEQPENFEFNSINLDVANKITKNYPEGKQQSAVMALLYIVQKQNDNWIPLAAMKYIAKLLKMPYIKVYEVATFYTMYNFAPVGKYHILLGKMYYDIGNISKSINHAKKAKIINPDHLSTKQLINLINHPELY